MASPKLIPNPLALPWTSDEDGMIWNADGDFVGGLAKLNGELHAKAIVETMNAKIEPTLLALTIGDVLMSPLQEQWRLIGTKDGRVEMTMIEPMCDGVISMSTPEWIEMALKTGLLSVKKGG